MIFLQSNFAILTSPLIEDKKQLKIKVAYAFTSIHANKKNIQELILLDILFLNEK